VKLAKFPFHKTLDDFDFSFQPSIDERLPPSERIPLLHTCRSPGGVGHVGHVEAIGLRLAGEGRDGGRAQGAGANRKPTGIGLRPGEVLPDALQRAVCGWPLLVDPVEPMWSGSVYG